MIVKQKVAPVHKIVWGTSVRVCPPHTSVICWWCDLIRRPPLEQVLTAPAPQGCSEVVYGLVCEGVGPEAGDGLGW